MCPGSSRLSPLRRADSIGDTNGDPCTVSNVRLPKRRDSGTNGGGGDDRDREIPVVTETNYVFAPSLPPSKQQPVLITAVHDRVFSCLLFARSLPRPSYPTFLPVKWRSPTNETRPRSRSRSRNLGVFSENLAIGRALALRCSSPTCANCRSCRCPSLPSFDPGIKSGLLGGGCRFRKKEKIRVRSRISRTYRWK